MNIRMIILSIRLLYFYFFHILLYHLPLFFGCKGMLYYSFSFDLENENLPGIYIEFFSLFFLPILVLTYYYFFKTVALFFNIECEIKLSKVSYKWTKNLLFFYIFFVGVLNGYGLFSRNYEDEYFVEFAFFFLLYYTIRTYKIVEYLLDKYFWKIKTNEEEKVINYEIKYLVFLFLFLIFWITVISHYGVLGLGFYLIFYLPIRILFSTNYISNLIFLIITFVGISLLLLLIFKFDFLSFVLLSLYVGGVLILFLTVIKLLGVEKRNTLSFLKSYELVEITTLILSWIVLPLFIIGEAAEFIF